MSNSIVRLDRNDIHLYSEYDGLGMESFGTQEFLRPPVIAVAQPTSDHKPEGEFYLNATGIGYGDKITVIPLHIQRTMAYRPDGSYDSPVLCWSRDFWMPAEDAQEKQSRACHKKTARKPVPVCSMAQWTGDKANRKPPSCEETWVLAVAIVGDNLVFERENCALLYLRKTNLPAIRDFMGQFRTLCKGLPLFGAGVELQLEYHTKKDGYQGNFYTIGWPDLRAPEQRFHIIPSAQMPELMEAYKFFAEYFSLADIVDSEEDVVDPSDGDDDFSPYTDNDFQSSAPVTAPTTSGSGWGAKRK